MTRLAPTDCMPLPRTRSDYTAQAIADVVEAILGAAYVSGGEPIALKAAQALCLPLLQIDRWTELTGRLLAPPASEGFKLRPGTLEAVERIVGHTFKHPHLLAHAVVRPCRAVHHSERC